MKTILFVCTGNTCRSSMAEGLFKEIVKNDEKLKNITIKSAGTDVYFKEKANQKAIETLKNIGIDISNHQTKGITDKLIDDADLILTMALPHKLRIVSMSANAAPKTFTLKEYVSENTCNDYDIVDPYGLSIEKYKKCAEEIKENLYKLKEKLKNN